MTGDESERLNYIRNSVKVTVDAYTGEMKAYAIEPNEPLLKAWRSVYPGLVRDASELPQGVAAHFRYPQDMLSLQSSQLCTYHVIDPKTFLGNGDAWNIAAQRGLEGEKEPIKPFYVDLKLPDSRSSEFVQILPFTPNARINMSGWLAARCDPGRYGQLTLYRLAQSNPIPGPEQMEGKFSTTPDISNINKQFQNQQSSIIVGNLLVIPIGDSFLYAETLFLKSNTQDLQAVPRLTKVILALENKVVVKDTYREALQALFGENQEPVEGQSTIVPVAGTQPSGTVQQVLGLLDRADQALRNGDFAGYGVLEKQARAVLKSAVAKPPAVAK
jgi:uncharacterized membrane protein (UPF0182 family)